MNTIAATHMIIVLGQALLHGSIPQISLISRVFTALSLISGNTSIKEKQSTILLLSGGTSPILSTNAPTPMSQYSESNIMENLVNTYYKEQLASTSILCESSSKNTIENALNCYSLLKDQSNYPQKYSIVTSEFHVPRTRCIFNNVFSSSVDRLSYVSSNSYLEKSLYRPHSLRPKKIDLWSLAERLDIELLAVDNLPQDMKGYGLLVSDESVAQARAEIEVLRKELGII